MTKCNHSHHHCNHHNHSNTDEEPKANWRTKLGTVGEMTDIIPNTLFFGSSVNTLISPFTRQDNRYFGVSLPAFICGFLFGILVTAGSTYCHNKLYIHHQDRDSDKKSTPATGKPISEREGEKTPLSGQAKSNAPLPFWKKAAVAGDALGHIGDKAGTLLIPFILSGTVAEEDKKLWVNPLILIGCFMFGLLVSLGDVQTCLDVLRKSNKNNDKNSDQPNHDQELLEVKIDKGEKFRKVSMQQ